MQNRRVRIAIVVFFLFSLALFLYSLPSRKEAAPVEVPAEHRQTLTEDTLQQVAALFAQARSGEVLPESAPAALRNSRAPVWLELRSRGRRLAAEWQTRGSWAENFAEALNGMRGGILEEADSAQLVLVTERHPIELPSPPELELELARGVLGLELDYGGSRRRFSPLEMLTDGISFAAARDRFLRSQGQDPEATLRRPLKAATLSGHQLMVSLGKRPQAVTMVRGNTPEPEVLPQSEVLEMRDQMAAYLVREAADDGKFPYVYLPQLDQESWRRELVIRQCLASWALARLAQQQPTEEHLRVAHAQLENMLRQYYRTDGKRGFVPDPDQTVKLGGMGLMGLALLESPFADEFEPLWRSLLRTTDEMWREDGSFVTLWGSDERQDGINFYPGEALLFWVATLEKARDAGRERRMRKSFAFYREHFRNQPNAAFVPWQAQVWARLDALAPDPELRDFVFEMSDWLLLMVLWEKAPFPDFKGMFWDPARPEQARVPHVTSTGVYLEGLASAYQLARRYGDRQRADNYRQAILKGLRSQRQHQFVDAVDLHFCPDPIRLRGALRSTVYNPAVRVDNVPHTLLALLRITQQFGAEDYQP